MNEPARLPSRFQLEQHVRHRGMFGRVAAVKFMASGAKLYDVKFQDPTGNGMKTLHGLGENALIPALASDRPTLPFALGEWVYCRANHGRIVAIHETDGFIVRFSVACPIAGNDEDEEMLDNVVAVEMTHAPEPVAMVSSS